MQTRRHFIRSIATTTAVVTAPNIIVGCASSGSAPRKGPNSRINIGVIGTGNQGGNDINSMIRDERVQIVAVCDVNRESSGYWNGAVAGREHGKRLVEGYYAKSLPSPGKCLALGSSVMK